MDFFLDTAEVEEIAKAVDWGMVDGVTTNPSLIAKSGRSYLPTLREIASIVPGPVSGEVLATDYEGMMSEGRVIADLANNMVVKVPLGVDGLRAVETLSKEGIKSNVTLCFSSAQALLAAKAGATYISPFIGRLDDIGQRGMQLIEEIKTIYSAYGFGTKILVASVRHCQHVVQSSLIGADVVTLPFSVLERLYNHPLTDKGLASFVKDWESTGKSFDD